MEKFIYTSNLSKRRDDLKSQILEAFNDTFFTELEDYSDIETYLDDEASEHITEEEREKFFSDWKDEIDEISEIDYIESECSDFEFGCILIHYDYFTEYTKDLLIDCGYIDKNLPTWIDINWESTAENVMYDYSYIDYLGETYLFR
jgi:hypothetical protein